MGKPGGTWLWLLEPAGLSSEPSAHDVPWLMTQGLANAGVARWLFLTEHTAEADDTEPVTGNEFPTQDAARTEINQRPLSSQVPRLVFTPTSAYRRHTHHSLQPRNGGLNPKTHGF